MTKYGRWAAPYSSSDSDNDPGNEEQAQGTKREIQNKVKKILKLIKSNDNNNSKTERSSGEENMKKQTELVELVEDFHKEYKSLHALYDHLRGELKDKFDNINEKDASTSPSSSSGSEYFSPEEVSIKNSKWSEPQVIKGLGNGSLDVNDLRRKLTFTTEIEGLDLEYKSALSKNQELRKTISDLEIEAEQRQNIIQAVKDESAKLKEKLGETEKYLVHQESDVSAWKKELERQIAALTDEQEFLCTKKRETEQCLENKAIEIKHLGEENSKLQAQVLKLEKTSEAKEKDYSAVVNKLTNHVKISESKINDLVAQVNDLQVEVDSLRNQKGKLEEGFESKIDKALAQADKERLFKDGQINNMQGKIFKLEKELKEKCEKYYSLQMKLETGDEFEKLKSDFESLQNEKIQSDLQRKQKKKQLTRVIEEQQRTLKEQENTINHLSKEYEHASGFILESKSKLQIYERKMAELGEDFCKKIEDNIRLLCQRIHVVEALHAENKEDYKVAKNKFEDEHRIHLLLRVNSNNSNLSEVEENAHLMNVVGSLEEKVTELMKLVKEKEEGIQEIGEEKREAIRQLCMLIDYHRSRYDHLKDLVSKLTARR